LYIRLLAEGKFYAAFLDIDVDLAASARAAGCSCGGALHGANYPRKPRGGPGNLSADYQYRLSLCCATDGCRKRVTPPSVRFLGRKVYLAAVVVLVSAMRQGPTPTRVAKLHDLLGVGERTLRRWRTWWQQIFSQGSFWRTGQARFMPPVVAAALPLGLWERFAGDAPERLGDLLRFVSPITTTTCPRRAKISEGDVSPAEDAG
jgi:hypothetical protein